MRRLVLCVLVALTVNAAHAQAGALRPLVPVPLAYGPNLMQFGLLRVPAGPGPHPVAVLVHGGCWSPGGNVAFMEPLSLALAQAGIATWNVEYRKVGDLGGGYPNTLTDVGRATDKLRELAGPFGLDLDRVAAVGHSAGGQLAVWAAARDGGDPLPLAGVVSLAGVLDLAAYHPVDILKDPITQWTCSMFVDPFMGGSPASVPDRYAAASPIALVPIGVRQHVLHGTADTTVPVSYSERYAAAATAAGDDVTLTRLEGAGHFDLITPHPAVMSAVAAAVGGQP
ncbi:MAG TPA: alpha/beta hydrolase [Solirubrobacteraceae bacterium]